MKRNIGVIFSLPKSAKYIANINNAILMLLVIDNIIKKVHDQFQKVEGTSSPKIYI